SGLGSGWTANRESACQLWTGAAQLGPGVMQCGAVQAKKGEYPCEGREANDHDAGHNPWLPNLPRRAPRSSSSDAPALDHPIREGKLGT
ncbi:MAG: hypothetical protein ACXW36_11110, partial [Nitrospira sp.]